MADPVALGPGASAVSFSDRSNNVETEAGAGNARRQRSRDTVEAFENFLQLHFGDPLALIADTHRSIFLVHDSSLYGHANFASRILDRIVDEIGNRRTYFVQVRQHHDRIAGPVDQRLLRQVV